MSTTATKLPVDVMYKDQRYTLMIEQGTNPKDLIEKLNRDIHNDSLIKIQHLIIRLFPLIILVSTVAWAGNRFLVTFNKETVLGMACGFAFSVGLMALSWRAKIPEIVLIPHNNPG